jgi:L-aminopeptidase/D-esterase-like protein
MRNLLTDVAGVRVGNAEDPRAATGTTVVLFEAPAVCAVDVRGGAPGTRETDLLSPERTVERVDAVVLSGGSAFGLDAASGVAAGLAATGRGFPVGDLRVPIVPAAILFDLLNGGTKDWGDTPPYRALGLSALAVATEDFVIGTVGAGFGATTADLKGGLGSASAVAAGGARVGAVVAVNAVGRTTIGASRHFWAAPFEVASEYGGHGWPPGLPADHAEIRLKGVRAAEATTIALVATDVTLSKAQCRHLAVMAQAGLARAIYPIHSPLDGDTVFAAATGHRAIEVGPALLAEIGAIAANVLARAVARAVYEADLTRGATTVPAYRGVYGG